MNAATATERPVSEPLVPDDVGDPPSLRRRAPARIDITLRSGRLVKVGRHRLHARAGQCLVLKITPQDGAHKVEVTAEPPLLTIVPNNRVEGGSVPTYHAEFCGRSPFGVIPVPNMGRIHVSVFDGLPEPCRMVIPVTIWPAFSTLVIWSLLAYLGIVGLRWQRTVAAGNSFEDILQACWSDLPYLILVLGISFLLFIPVQLLGWVIDLIESLWC